MRPSEADGTGAWMRGQGRSSAMTGEHPLEYPLECECEWSTLWSTLSCTIEIVTRLCPDGDAPWRACSWVCVSGPAARASRRGAWSCEFSSSKGAGMWSPRTPRTRRAGLGRGGGGARLSSPWTLARGQAPGGARLSTLTRECPAVLLSTDGESACGAPCVAGPGWTWWIPGARRLPVRP